MPTDTPRATYDLHLHTYWSYDAHANPEFYFRVAHENRVRCIAITDHHVLDAQDEVFAAAQKYPGVKFMLAAELTVTTSLGAIDILCYGFPAQETATLRQLKNIYHEWQRAHGAGISAGMQSIGYGFSDADRLELLRSYRPENIIAVQGNTHVKNGLLRDYFVEQGYMLKPEDYQSLLQRAEKGKQFPQYPAVSTVLPLLREIGAVTAIAHPYGYFQQDNIERMDTLREECGLAGIECAHPSVPTAYTLKYRQYCEQHKLFSVGGSDTHTDDSEAEENIARHRGEAVWLDEFLARVPNLQDGEGLAQKI